MYHYIKETLQILPYAENRVSGVASDTAFVL